jgi:hypothetical protein
MPTGNLQLPSQRCLFKALARRKRLTLGVLSAAPQKKYLFERFAREPNINVAALDAGEDARHERRVTLFELTHRKFDWISQI